MCVFVCVCVCVRACVYVCVCVCLRARMLTEHMMLAFVVPEPAHFLRLPSRTPRHQTVAAHITLFSQGNLWMAGCPPSESIWRGDAGGGGRGTSRGRQLGDGDGASARRSREHQAGHLVCSCLFYLNTDVREPT